MHNRRFLVRMPLVVMAAAALALGAVQVAGASSKATPFSDPAGDNGSAPDITAVQVSDDGNGQVTFQLPTPGTADLTGEQHLVLLIDSDQNGATGSGGFDYVFDVGAAAYDFARWNGSDWDSTAPNTTVRVLYDSGGLISINHNELGGTNALNFRFRTFVGDGNIGHFDDAPDSGTWSYTLSGAAPAPTMPAPTTPAPTTPAPTTPAPNPPAPAPTISSLLIPFTSMLPKAGHVYRFVVSSVRLGSQAFVAPSAVVCTATLAGVPLRGSGKGGCSWLLAKSTRGKRLLVTAKVTYKSASITRKYPMKVT